MQATYARYRDLKREIRHSAAIDIQRIIRGFVCRAALKRRKMSRKSSQTFFHPATVGSDSMTAPSLASSGSSTGNSRKGWSGAEHTTLNNAVEQDSVSAEQELCNRYKDFLLQKKTLKRKLKRFDEEYFSKNGRLPKKADKEIMRPHYQKYHEVCFSDHLC